MPRRRGRGVRVPRPERRRQDDRGQAAARAHPADGRRAGRSSGAPLGDLATRRRIGYLPGAVPLPGVADGARGARAPRRAGGARRGAAPAGGRAGARARRPRRPRRRPDRAASRRACSSASASARRCSATRRSSSSTSPRPPSIPSVATTSAAIIREAQARGSAVLLNSHLLGEVERLCDRVAIVNRGAVVAAGPLGDAARPGGRPDPGHGPAGGPVGPRRLRGPRGRRGGLARSSVASTTTASPTSSRRSSLPAAGSTPSTPAGAASRTCSSTSSARPRRPRRPPRERRGSCWSIAALTLREIVRRRVVWVLVVPGGRERRARRVGDAAARVHRPRRGRSSRVQLQIGVSQVLILIAFMFSFVLAMSAAFLAAPAIAVGRRDGDGPRDARAAAAPGGARRGPLARPVDRRRGVRGRSRGCWRSRVVALVSGHVPPEPLVAVVFLAFQAIAVLTLALALGTRLPAMAAGAITVVLFGLGWFAGVLGQPRRRVRRAGDPRDVATRCATCCRPTGCGAAWSTASSRRP